MRRVASSGGLSIVAIWSLGFAIISALPSTLSYGEVVARGRETDVELLRFYLDPRYVSLATWINQIIATSILTILATLAVFRSRRHLVAEVAASAVRDDLARYVSPDVAKAVRGADAMFGAPTTRAVAVLFADIIGFTAVSKKLPPDQTFELLRDFHSRSSQAVFEHGGTLDKYLGDGLMATFGALRDEADAAVRAIRCAFRLRDEVARWYVAAASRPAKAWVREAAGERNQAL